MESPILSKFLRTLLVVIQMSRSVLCNGSIQSQLSLFSPLICDGTAVCVGSIPVKSFVVGLQGQCVVECKRQQRQGPEPCVGVNYRQENNLCDIFSDVDDFTNFTKNEPGCQYIQVCIASIQSHFEIQSADNMPVCTVYQLTYAPMTPNDYFVAGSSRSASKVLWLNACTTELLRHRHLHIGIHRIFISCENDDPIVHILITCEILDIMSLPMRFCFRLIGLVDGAGKAWIFIDQTYRGMQSKDSSELEINVLELLSVK